MNKTLREKYPNTEFFLVRIFLYSDWIQENTEQKKLRLNLCLSYSFFDGSKLKILSKCHNSSNLKSTYGIPHGWLFFHDSCKLLYPVHIDFYTLLHRFHKLIFGHTVLHLAVWKLISSLQGKGNSTEAIKQFQVNTVVVYPIEQS